MSWFNFLLGLDFIPLCFDLIIIHYHTPKQVEIKFKPRTKFSDNIYVPTAFVLASLVKERSIHLLARLSLFCCLVYVPRALASTSWLIEGGIHVCIVHLFLFCRRVILLLMRCICPLDKLFYRVHNNFVHSYKLYDSTTYQRGPLG